MKSYCHTHLITILIILASVTVNVWGEDTVSVACKTTSQRDTLICGDSTIIIHTVCAPICSSHVSVYTKDGKLIGTIPAPLHTVFPEAYIESGNILWRDNTPQMLDDSERRALDKQADKDKTTD